MSRHYPHRRLRAQTGLVGRRLLCMYPFLVIRQNVIIVHTRSAISRRPESHKSTGWRQLLTAAVGSLRSSCLKGAMHRRAGLLLGLARWWGVAARRRTASHCPAN